jgi:hypothetical protein
MAENPGAGVDGDEFRGWAWRWSRRGWGGLRGLTGCIAFCRRGDGHGGRYSLRDNTPDNLLARGCRNGRNQEQVRFRGMEDGGRKGRGRQGDVDGVEESG